MPLVCAGKSAFEGLRVEGLRVRGSKDLGSLFGP